MANLGVLLLALLALATSTLAACPSNGAAVGFSGPIVPLDHGVRCPDLLLPCRPLTSTAPCMPNCMPITKCAAEPTHWHKRQRYTCNARNREAGPCTAAAGA
jgi:hypothetical protein